MIASFLTEARREFHRALVKSGALTLSPDGIASNADSDNTLSCLLAREMINEIGTVVVAKKLSGQQAGKHFEKATADFFDTTFRALNHLRPGVWTVSRGLVEISHFDQYEHLAELSRLAKTNRELSAALGSDYIIKPDITVGRHPEDDAKFDDPTGKAPHVSYLDDATGTYAPLRRKNGAKLILHASISCKWTLRSDRSQNARSEGLNLVRNRKGRLPHIAVITAEPLPSRIASIALGTGDIDCVYHVALPELMKIVSDKKLLDAEDLLKTMILGKRLRDISDLPIDLVV